ncbi:MAG TPA: alpha/beta fold hydrolase [Trebonia sp.]|nr:alpha/beta fold hydrolase [Trebonia sp.]
MLSATVFGSGEPAVVIEPSFGGWAGDWRAIAEPLGSDTTVVTYDRAPYGDSSRARDRRTPGDIATDLHAALAALDVTGPVVLVGHSLGGMYVRKYAALYPSGVAGMVLVESSHEGQKPLLDKVFTLRTKLLGLLMYPEVIFSTRGGRAGADRSSLFREWFTSEKITAGDKPLAPGALGDTPLIVLTRSDGGPFGGRQWALWHGFHQEQAQLSANTRHVISGSTDHFLHRGDRELVVAAIREVVRSARTGTPVRDLAGEASQG